MKNRTDPFDLAVLCFFVVVGYGGLMLMIMPALVYPDGHWWVTVFLGAPLVFIAVGGWILYRREMREHPFPPTKP